MKKLMMIAVSVLACAVLAEEAECKCEGQAKKGPRDRGAFAAERGMFRHGFGGDMMGDAGVMAVMNPKIAGKLGLSEDVQAKLKGAAEESKKSVQDLQAKVREAMDKQAKLMKEPKIDEAAVMSVIDELFELRKEMAKAQTKRVIAIKSLITPEQLAQACELMKAQREEWRAKHGPKGPRGPKPEGEKPADAE